MKLLKRDRVQLERILAQLKRGQQHLMQVDILVCMVMKHASTTLHYVNGQGSICYSVDKEIGSELALLHTGIKSLEGALYGEEEVTP